VHLFPIRQRQSHWLLPRRETAQPFNSSPSTCLGAPCAVRIPHLLSRQAAQRHDMHLAFGVVLGLLHPSIAVLAHLEELFLAGLEKPVLVLHVERNAPLGGPITQKAPHRILPWCRLGQRGIARFWIVMSFVSYAW